MVCKTSFQNPDFFHLCPLKLSGEMVLEESHILSFCIFFTILKKIRNAALISPSVIFIASQCAADFSRASCAVLQQYVSALRIAIKWKVQLYLSDWDTLIKGGIVSDLVYC